MEIPILRRIKVDMLVCILISLQMITVPLKWLAASFMAALIHESGHITAILIFRGSIRQIEMRIGGICILAYGMTQLQSAISVAAGPFASLLLILLLPWYPRLAICGALQGAFNLLPWMPLDGGRLIKIMFNDE